MEYGRFRGSITPGDEDNVIAALEHPDRVCRIRLDMTRSELGRIARVMQEPFPVLTRLWIHSDKHAAILPSGFLGGSAPSLQKIVLFGVPYPALPTLLLSASDLVELNLHDIPKTGYIPPEAMVASLAALPRLETLYIGFEFDPFRADLLLPATRAVLPALNYMSFSGVCEYLENFLARIDAPQLNTIAIFYSDQFEVPQLSEFINRSENLKRTLSRYCRLLLGDFDDFLDFSIGGLTSDDEAKRSGRWEPGTGISVCIICKGRDQQIMHLTHLLGWISPILSDMVHFTIRFESFMPEPFPEPEDLDDIEWLEFLRRFSSVRTLFVSGELAGHVSRALEDIPGAIATEVLPSLDLLCLEDEPVSSVDKFIDDRRDSGHPVTIVDTKREFDERLEAYPP